MHWHVDEDSVEEVKPEPPSFVINSDDGTLWIAPGHTPLSRGVSASLGVDWKPLGVLSDDGLRGPEIPHVGSGMQEFTVNMLDWNDQVRELFFGDDSKPPELPPLDGPSAALLGQECTHDDYWRAWQKWPEEMRSMELTRHYGAFRQRYACGVDYITGP